MDPIKFLIVDDHALVRMGLKTSLEMEPDFRVVAEASNGKQALQLYELHRPDVCLMDLRLQAASAIDTITQLGADHPSAIVIVISSFQGGDDILRALQAGAKTYLPKSLPRDEMIAAIRSIIKGEGYLPPTVASRLAERLKRPHLTNREVEVLRLVARGETNKEIGAALSLAEVTVKLHVGKILEKLSVRDRTEAARFAIESGMIWLD